MTLFAEGGLPLAEELTRAALSLGTSGLLFVMWWYERQERVRQGQIGESVQRDSDRCLALTRDVLAVIQANTAALAALREELRGLRERSGGQRP